MKFSTHHKRRSDQVRLMRRKRIWKRSRTKPVNLAINTPMKKFDKAHISCIFKWNSSLARSIAVMLKSLGVDVEIGGSGIDLNKSLPENVEHLMPDYRLYNLDFSMGFLTRGCFRNCPWCIVPKKEGDIKLGSNLEEFLSPRHSRVMLLDNNLLAHPNHSELLLNLLDYRLEICFTQGLDIRLINDENAKLLRYIRYRDTKFKTPRLYFSWDLLEIEEDVLRGIEILKRHGITPNRCFFYLLCGFDVKPEEYTWQYFLEHDWYRFEVLKKIGTLPFIMVYNNRNDIPLLRAFSRWVNFMFKAKKKELGLLHSFTSYLEHDERNVWKVYKKTSQ